MADLELHADFDHDGRLTESPTERAARQGTLGAIVIANLDVDARRLPTAVTAGSPLTLDYAQPTKPAADDEVIAIRVRVLNPLPAGASLLARISGINAVRTRLYDDQGRILPAPLAKPDEREIPLGQSAVLDLRMEARTVPGSPYGHATLLDPNFPAASPDELAFRLELFHRTLTGDVTQDGGSFSVAPVIFLDNLGTVERLYICELPANEPSVADVRDALRSIGGPRLTTVPVEVAMGDSWLQDQFQPGIVVGPIGWRHLIVHLPRLRSNFVISSASPNLATFVRSHFPAKNVGVLDDFYDRRLVFDDATGRRIELAVRETVALAERMGRVFSARRGMTDTIGRIDPDWEDSDVSGWAGARTGLAELLKVLGRKVADAKRNASADWAATLDGLLVLATSHVRLVERQVPLGTAQDRFVLATPSTSFEVDGKRADELEVRIGQFNSSGNYGGNIEVAPPTASAPLGTIVIGNVKIEGRGDFVDPDVLRLLHAPRKQPVVEVDTTWLDVGHVDEVLSFVGDRGGATGFGVLRASSALALRLVSIAADRYILGLPMAHPNRDRLPAGKLQSYRLTHQGTAPVTRLFRGKLWEHLHEPPSSPDVVPDVLEPPRIYQALSQAFNGGNPADPDSGRINIHGIRYWPGVGPRRVYPADITVLELLDVERDNQGESVNEFVEEQFLSTIAERVARAFPDARIIPIPVLFDRVGSVGAWRDNPMSFATSAFSPDVINLQVVNGQLLLPRPYGPRMRADDAVAAVREACAELGDVGSAIARNVTTRAIQRRGLDVCKVWLHREESIARPVSRIGTVRSVFDGLVSLRDVVKAFKDGFPGTSDDDIGRAILAANRRAFTPTNELRDGWRKLTIPERTVDLFELYVEGAAATIGARIHWVDSWFYHVHYGGIHCGTNVLRKPPADLPHWWDVPDVVPSQTIDMGEGEVITAPR